MDRFFWFFFLFYCYKKHCLSLPHTHLPRHSGGELSKAQTRIYKAGWQGMHITGLPDVGFFLYVHLENQMHRSCLDHTSGDSSASRVHHTLMFAKLGNSSMLVNILPCHCQHHGREVSIMRQFFRVLRVRAAAPNGGSQTTSFSLNWKLTRKASSQASSKTWVGNSASRPPVMLMLIMWEPLYESFPTL